MNALLALVISETYTLTIYTHFYVHNKRTILKPYRQKKNTLNENHAYRTNKPNMKKKILLRKFK